MDDVSEQFLRALSALERRPTTRRHPLHWHTRCLQHRGHATGPTSPRATHDPHARRAAIRPRHPATPPRSYQQVSASTQRTGPARSRQSQLERRASGGSLGDSELGEVVDVRSARAAGGAEPFGDQGVHAPSLHWPLVLVEDFGQQAVGKPVPPSRRTDEHRRPAQAVERRLQANRIDIGELGQQVGITVMWCWSSGSTLMIPCSSTKGPMVAANLEPGAH